MTHLLDGLSGQVAHQLAESRRAQVVAAASARICSTVFRALPAGSGVGHQRPHDDPRQGRTA